MLGSVAAPVLPKGLYKLQAFFDVILPIFAVVGVGSACAWFGFLDRSAAAMLNRFVFYVGLPPLLFRLVVTAPVDQFNGFLLGAFVAVELFVYFIAISLYRFYFKTRKFSWVMTRKLSETLSRNFVHSCGMVLRMNARMALANCFWLG